MQSPNIYPLRLHWHGLTTYYSCKGGSRMQLFAKSSNSFVSARGFVGVQRRAPPLPLVQFVVKGRSFIAIKTSSEDCKSPGLDRGACLEADEKDRAHKIRSILSKCRTGASEAEVLQFLLRNKAISENGISHGLVRVLLEGLSDDWKSALGFFRWAGSQPDYELSAESYDKMVDILGKMRQVEQMWKLVEEMREKGLVTLKTVAKVMRRLAGFGRYEDAIKTFDELEDFGLQKNVESMNTLVDTLCKEGRIERAREIYLELKQHIPPNAHTFAILIHGWCKVDRVDEAHWTVLEMRGHGFRPCVVSSSTILQGYCKQSNFCKAFELLDEMRANGCSPNVVTYTSIIHSLAREKRMNEAFQIIDLMKEDGCQPDTIFYNTLIHILGNARMVDKAAHVFLVEMPMYGVMPNVSTYNTLISIFCHHSQEKNALHILREMDRSTFLKPELLTYYPLLKLCFRMGKPDDYLRKMLDDMLNRHHLSFDLDTYTLLIHGLCHSGKINWAYQLFLEMINQDITPKYKTCRLLLKEADEKFIFCITDSVKTYMERAKKFL